MRAYQEYLKEILIDAETLQGRIAEVGQEISQDYHGKDNMVLLCILKGGVMFMSDLSRRIDVPHSLEFLSVSSYGSSTESSQVVTINNAEVLAKMKGKHLLIVEDIIDTGNTLSAVMQVLRKQDPASVKLCTLLDKPERREIDIQIDYIGFSIANKFVFGYGLDLHEYYRNLPFIGVVDLNKLALLEHE